MSVRSGSCGKDGFPKFPEGLAPEVYAEVDKMKRELDRLSIALRNTNSTSIARMNKQSTKDEARKRHGELSDAKQALLQKAMTLYFEVTDKKTVDEMRIQSGSASSGMDMQTVQKMCVAAATMALSRQANTMQQQQAALTDGAGIGATSYVNDLAVQKLAEKPSYEVEEKAVKHLLKHQRQRLESMAIQELKDDLEAVVRSELKRDMEEDYNLCAEIRQELKDEMRAAKRARSAKSESDDEEEKEEEEEETSSDDE